MNRCFMFLFRVCLEQAWETFETWCFRAAPAHGGRQTLRQRSLWGENPTHEPFANSHRPSNCSRACTQLLTRFLDGNILQCVNIEIVVLLSSPMLTAQQGNSCCCLCLCKLSLIKPSHKRHRQMSSFCNADVCLFVIN